MWIMNKTQKLNYKHFSFLVPYIYKTFLIKLTSNRVTHSLQPDRNESTKTMITYTKAMGIMYKKDGSQRHSGSFRCI